VKKPMLAVSNTKLRNFKVFDIGNCLTLNFKKRKLWCSGTEYQGNE